MAAKGDAWTTSFEAEGENCPLCFKSRAKRNVERRAAATRVAAIK